MHMHLYYLTVLIPVHIIIGMIISRVSLGEKRKRPTGTTSREDFGMVVVMLFWPFILVYGILIFLAGGRSGTKSRRK